jgi:L-ascorbate metabolism protein UlaG (beta-lactamase superfamily)
MGDGQSGEVPLSVIGSWQATLCFKAGKEKSVQLQLIRNATVRLNYRNHIFLTDPYFAERFGGLSYAGITRSPLAELPFPVGEILAGVDTVIVSHLHSDHFDKVAQLAIPKEMPLICQAEDEAAVGKRGFKNVHPISQGLHWKGIEIQRVIGKHGSGPVMEEMGTASGFLLQAPNEPLLYWAGDTILCDEVLAVLTEKQPKVVLTHSCGAQWGDHVKIVMDDEQTISICKLLPDSIIIAIHMDTVDHATVSRSLLREYARNHGIDDRQLLIPENGENISVK